MKKLFLLVSIISLPILSAFATETSSYRYDGNDTIYFQILEASSSRMEILVSESSVVDDFCNFLSRKDIGVSVGLWCAFMPGNPLCTVYGAAMLACSVYKAVKLTIEGDFSDAILETVSASTKVYKMTKVDSSSYKIQ